MGCCLIVIVPMDVGHSFAVPVHMDVRRERTAVRPDVKPVVFRVIVMIVRVPRSVVVMMVMMSAGAVAVSMTAATDVPPSRQRDPASERDQRKAGYRVDRISYTRCNASARDPNQKTNYEGGEHVPGASLGGRKCCLGTRPATLTRYQRDWNPVVRHQRVQDAHDGNAQCQKPPLSIHRTGSNGDISTSKERVCQSSFDKTSRVAVQPEDTRFQRLPPPLKRVIDNGAMSMRQNEFGFASIAWTMVARMILECVTTIDFQW
jgi:hypothetical protein